MPEPAFVMPMADGTIKQINPSTGAKVWTVPGRSARPLTPPQPAARPISDTDWTHGCAFCSARYMETPPEKARMVCHDGVWQTIEATPAEALFDSVAEFRVVPNLFEIVSYDYWHKNYGYQLPADQAERKHQYMATEQGRRHVFSVLATKLRQNGKTADDISKIPADWFVSQADGFFGGGHDVVIARRHWIDGARTTADLASSGSLTADEHEQYIRITLKAMDHLYSSNRYTRFVAVFQNWLKPAGASFDHLHKQLVAIDEHGTNADQVAGRLRDNPNFFNECGVNYASYHNLLVAENDSAIVIAGFGHRYPTIEIYSKSAQIYPWLQSDKEVRDMSDLIHAMHLATGADVASNEEWHSTPVDMDVAMPWRINLKWRISTIAGFEGDTKIYINTISPMELRQIVTGRLQELRSSGQIGDLRIGDECSGRPNPLRYVEAF
jgi:galactose-1-phosphate uridylyltransferase